MSSGFEGQLAWVNGQPEFIGYESGQPATVLVFEIVDGRIQAIHAIRNPNKLKRLPPLA